MEKTVQFCVEDFEGPLDLLLALVSKNKMSIYNIEILLLINQYLQVVGSLGGSQLDNASEFITMAARLVQIKSAMLLPRSDEAQRMREELTGLLVEYSACKKMAARLREMAACVFIVARRPAKVQLDAQYRGRHTPTQLAAAFATLAGRKTARRPPRAEQFEPLVTAPFVSVTGRVIYLLRGLKNGAFVLLKQAFTGCTNRSESVATFLALLELVRGGRVEINAQGGLSLSGHGKATTAHSAKPAAGTKTGGKAAANGTE